MRIGNKLVLYVTGIPGVFTIIWALCAHYYHDEQMCWRNFTATPFFAIIMAPICIAVAVSHLRLESAKPGRCFGDMNKPRSSSVLYM